LSKIWKRSATRLSARVETTRTSDSTLESRSHLLRTRPSALDCLLTSTRELKLFGTAKL
jgi:hypothetical protein